MYLLNAFSANMLAAFPASVLFAEISVEEARALAPSLTSAIGFPDAAAVFGTVLGHPVAVNPVSVSLSVGDTAVLGQYRGPRLPTGATTLPAGATIQWLRVTVS